MATTIKRFLVGRAKRTDQAIHERLTKKTGLAVFASDALSSTAYASEEIMLVLAVAAVYGQTHAFNYVVPITLVIAVVLGKPHYHPQASSAASFLRSSSEAT